MTTNRCCPVCKSTHFQERQSATVTIYQCRCGYTFTEKPTTTTGVRHPAEPTPVAKAEAAREELEKFAAWIEAEWFDNVDTPNEVVEAYLHDVASGWKPEADNDA